MIKVFRQFEEVLQLQGGSVPVTSQKFVGDFDDELVEDLARQMSVKKSGIFWMVRSIDGRQRMGGFVPSDPLEPDYLTFSAGYLNGKKVFPKAAQLFKPDEKTV